MEIFFKVDGIRNPVKAAYFFLKETGCDIDEESFEDVAFWVGDIETNDEGFLVNDLEDIQRLCRIGKFQLWCINGKITVKI